MLSRILLSAWILVITMSVVHAKSYKKPKQQGRFEFNLTLASDQGGECTEDDLMKIKYFMWSNMDSWVQTKTNRGNGKETSVEYLDCTTCNTYGRNLRAGEKKMDYEYEIEGADEEELQAHRHLPNWGNYNGGGGCSCNVCNCDNGDGGRRRLKRVSPDLETGIARNVAEGMHVLAKYEKGNFCMRGDVVMTIQLFM